MNFTKTTFLRLIIFIFCFNFSCQKNEVKTKVKITKKIKSSDFFNSIRDSSDKIVIKLYYNKDPKTLRSFKNVVWKKEVSSKKKLTSFDSFFNNLDGGGYFCCPYTHYNISFYHKNKEIRIYNVDTSTFKNQALFFDTSFQTNYLVPLNKWNDFIKNSDK